MLRTWFGIIIADVSFVFVLRLSLSLLLLFVLLSLLWLPLLLLLLLLLLLELLAAIALGNHNRIPIYTKTKFSDSICFVRKTTYKIGGRARRVHISSSGMKITRQKAILLTLKTACDELA